MSTSGKRGKTIVIGIIALIIGIGIGIGISEPAENSSITSQDQTIEQNLQLTGEVTIGLILPLTGDLSTHGEENMAGSKLAVVDFNKHLDKLGASWTLKMVSEDSATSPVIALEKLTALNARGIKIVVGPETSSAIRNVKGYADSNSMLLISPSSTAPALAIPGDSVYRLVPDDSNQGPAIANLIRNEGIEVIVPVWRGDAWGDGLSKSTTESFVKRGGITYEGIRYNPEAPEFSATTSLLAEKVQSYVEEVGAEKVAVLIVSFSETLQFMQSAAQHDVLDDVRWFGTDANTKEDKLINDPIAREFSLTTQFTTAQVTVSNNPIHEHVESSLTSELGRIPNAYAFSSYDVVWIIGLAMLQTESSDVSAIKEIIPDIAKNYYGAIGSTRLNEAGDLAMADYDIWGIRNGQWILIGKYTQATDSISKI